MSNILWINTLMDISIYGSSWDVFKKITLEVTSSNRSNLDVNVPKVLELASM